MLDKNWRNRLMYRFLDKYCCGGFPVVRFRYSVIAEAFEDALCGDLAFLLRVSRRRCLAWSYWLEGYCWRSVLQDYFLVLTKCDEALLYWYLLRKVPEEDECWSSFGFRLEQRYGSIAWEEFL